MDVAEALLQTTKDEALDMGCAGSHDYELLSDMLRRIADRTKRLLTPELRAGNVVVSRAPRSAGANPRSSVALPLAPRPGGRADLCFPPD